MTFYLLIGLIWYSAPEIVAGVGWVYRRLAPGRARAYDAQMNGEDPS